MFSVSARLRPCLVLTLAGLSLCACISAHHSSTLSALPADLVASGRIDSVTFAHDQEIKVSDGFDEVFKTRVQAELAKCAKGTRPLRLEATLSRLDKTNPAVTLVLGGGRSAVRGHAKLIDEASGKTVGEYEIGQTVFGTRLATVQMLQPEKEMADAFGQEVCLQAFPAASASH
jgi:hypothetical protein